MVDVERKMDKDSTEKRLYRQKVIYSISMCFSYFVYGLIFAQTDSALLELQKITSVTLEQASLYVTMSGFGFLVGSLMCGAVYNQVNKFLSQSVILFLTAVVLVIIPWCNSHVAMTTAHTVVGGLMGFLDTVVIAEMLAVWGTDGRGFVQAINLGYAVGGVISPILVANFSTTATGHDGISFYETSESSPTTTRMTDFSKVVDKNLNSNLIAYKKFNFPEDHQQLPVPVNNTSHIHIAYIISACTCMIIGMPFLIMCLSFNRDIYSERSKPEVTSSIHDSRCWKIAVLANTGILAGLYMAMVDTFAGFLIAFCVSQMNWRMWSGSLLLSFMEGCFCLGLILSIFWVRYIKPKNILGIFCPLVSVMFFIMTWCGLKVSNYGIWISIGTEGFLMSVVYPTIFTWVEEDYFPVTGKIASFLNVTASIGATISPIVSGVLMDRYSPMCFTYILLVESWLMMFLYMVGVMLIRKSQPNRKTYAYVKLEAI